MFDKLKQMQEMKNLQDEIKKEVYELEKNGTKIVMNGGMQLQEIHLNPNLSQEEQEKTLLEAHQELMQKVQMAMAQKFRGMM